jgi:hypothetical protein
MDHEPKFQKLVQFRAPESLSDMIEAAAGRHLQSRSEYIRRGVVERLQADGFDPAAITPRDAGSLYNVIAGQRHYALVSAGRILAQTSRLDSVPDLADASHHPVGYVPADGDRWLPVEFADSEPFDIAAHWRLAPIDSVEANRVVRTYPIIPKSLEAM